MIPPPSTSTLFPYTTLFRSLFAVVIRSVFLAIEFKRRRLIVDCCCGRYDGLDVVNGRSEEHTSELQSLTNLVCRLLLEKKKNEDQTCARKYTLISKISSVDI